MSDSDRTESSEPRCPACGHPVLFGEQDTTAFEGEGREYRRGAAVCMNEACVMYGQPVNLG
jgi:DNA-directed RNA polymerase subunit RPC12/RpoP